MQALRFLFSPSGRLRPQAFAVAAIAVYAAGLASQLLTTPRVIARDGLWPFAMVQVVLVWVWFSLHAKRLRDADRSIGLAAAASVLYILAVVLLLMVAASFVDPSTADAGGPNATSALALILLVWITAILSNSAGYDLVWVVIAILTVLAFLPSIVVLAVTLWAATRPSVESRSAV